MSKRLRLINYTELSTSKSSKHSVLRGRELGQLG